MPHSVALVEGSDNGIVKDVPKEYNDQWMNNTLCYVCNKPSTLRTSDFITMTLPDGATTIVHKDCQFRVLDD